MGWRTIFGLVAGVVIGTLVILGLEMLGHMFFPVTADVAGVDAMPMGTKLTVIGAYAIASLVGGAVAGWIGRNLIAAVAVGAVLLALGIWNMTMIPHPMWMIVANCVALFLPAILGGSLTARRAAT